jgi:hypothetical protein
MTRRLDGFAASHPMDRLPTARAALAAAEHTLTAAEHMGTGVALARANVAAARRKLYAIEAAVVLAGAE